MHALLNIQNFPSVPKRLLNFGFGAVGKEEWKRAETCWATKIINDQAVRWVFVKSPLGEAFRSNFCFLKTQQNKRSGVSDCFFHFRARPSTLGRLM